MTKNTNSVNHFRSGNKWIINKSLICSSAKLKDRTFCSNFCLDFWNSYGNFHTSFDLFLHFLMNIGQASEPKIVLNLQLLHLFCFHGKVVLNFQSITSRSLTPLKKVSKALSFRKLKLCLRDYKIVRNGKNFFACISRLYLFWLAIMC